MLVPALVVTPAFAQNQPQVINIPLTRPGETVNLDISILSARIEVIGEDREIYSITGEGGGEPL